MENDPRPTAEMVERRDDCGGSRRLFRPRSLRSGQVCSEHVANYMIDN